MSNNSGRLGLEVHENCMQIGRETTKLLTNEYSKENGILDTLRTGEGRRDFPD